MSKQPGLLPKIEIVIVGLLFLAFLIWSISKCSSTRRAYEEQAALEAEDDARYDSLEKARQQAFVPLDTVVRPQKKELPGEAAERITPLFVITPALNMRTGPGLKFTVLERLQLHDELLFLGDVTDTTQQIDLGQIVADEPWVKVRSESGKEGWVYGACVDFYKRELKGVEVD